MLISMARKESWEKIANLDPKMSQFCALVANLLFDEIQIGEIQIGEIQNAMQNVCWNP